MAEKHEPQPLDLYRCQDGTQYIIVAVWEEKGMVEYLDMEEEQIDSMGLDLMERDEFKGNVLALPDALEACKVLLAEVKGLHSYHRHTCPGDPCLALQARKAGEAALAKAGLQQ